MKTGAAPASLRRSRRRAAGRSGRRRAARAARHGPGDPVGGSATDVSHEPRNPRRPGGNPPAPPSVDVRPPPAPTSSGRTASRPERKARARRRQERKAGAQAQACAKRGEVRARIRSAPAGRSTSAGATCVAAASSCRARKSATVITGAERSQRAAVFTGEQRAFGRGRGYPRAMRMRKRSSCDSGRESAHLG